MNDPSRQAAWEQFRSRTSVCSFNDSTSGFGKKEMIKHLLLQLLSELLGLALFVVVHNHHGGIDLPNGHVTG